MLPQHCSSIQASCCVVGNGCELQLGSIQQGCLGLQRRNASTSAGDVALKGAARGSSSASGAPSLGLLHHILGHSMTVFYPSICLH